MAQQEFGGDWTQDKLERLKGYLEAYMQIFKHRPNLRPIYVDAFAGTGSIAAKAPRLSATQIDEPEKSEVEIFLNGSARIALEVEPPFSRYLFIERSAKKVVELRKLRDEYPQRSARIQIERAEANQFLMQWCAETNWLTNRAVVFLDPFGMQVEWQLLETIAATEAIDLWLLVPLGMGVNRMLTQNELPPKEWQDRLTKFFGTDEWQEQFYSTPKQGSLFDDGPSKEKVANWDALASYFVDRLKGIFKGGVAPNPLTQRNSKNSPLFLLCFAAGNPNLA
jgi:three-Cys-motif partner protein